MSVEAVAKSSSSTTCIQTPTILNASFVDFIGRLASDIFQASGAQNPTESSLVAPTNLAAALIVVYSGTTDSETKNLIHNKMALETAEKSSQTGPVTFRTFRNIMLPITRSLHPERTTTQLTMLNCLSIRTFHERNSHFQDAMVLSQKGRDEIGSKRCSLSSISPEANGLIQQCMSKGKENQTTMGLYTHLKTVFEYRFKRIYDDRFLCSSGHIIMAKFLEQQVVTPTGFIKGHTVVSLPYAEEGLNFYLFQPHNYSEITKTEQSFYEMLNKVSLTRRKIDVAMPKLLLQMQENRISLLKAAGYLSRRRPCCINNFGDYALLEVLEEKIAGSMNEEGPDSAPTINDTPSSTVSTSPTPALRVHLSTPYVWCIAKKVHHHFIIVMAGSNKDSTFFELGSTPNNWYRTDQSTTEYSSEEFRKIIYLDPAYRELRRSIARHATGDPVSAVKFQNRHLVGYQSITDYVVINYTQQAVMITPLSQLLLNGSFVFINNGTQIVPLSFNNRSQKMIVFECRGNIYVIGNDDLGDNLFIYRISHDPAITQKLTSLDNL